MVLWSILAAQQCQTTLEPLVHTMIAVFANRAQARAATDALLAAGFGIADIVATADPAGLGAAPARYVLSVLINNARDTRRAAAIVGRHGPVGIDARLGRRLLGGA